ncbi:MAG: WXG100 family type VII secretion target [Mycobacterium sp.]|nr:WXG100 family type VII secretion target [Mycobacterium sp.]
MQSWNPEALTSAASSIRSSGESIYDAVRNLDDRIDRMSAEKAWSGEAHKAAGDMFGRATDRSSACKNYTDRVAATLDRGGDSISGWRTSLPAKASEIDAGPLNVTDQWVVFIDQAGMSAELAAELEAQAKAAQAEINPLLVGLDEADTATSTALLAAQATEGIATDLPGKPPVSLTPYPQDEVLHTDKNGNWISDTMTTPREDGGTLTEISWADGTRIDISETADGVRTGSCTTADGRESVLPDSFFNNPIPTLAGGVYSGIETAAGRGMFGVSAAELDKVRIGAKFGGPALGVATMVYDLVSADTLRERCIAAWSGGTGLVGGLATSVAVAAVPGVGPFAAMGANVAGGFVFGYVGKLVGNIMCPP